MMRRTLAKAMLTLGSMAAGLVATGGTANAGAAGFYGIQTDSDRCYEASIWHDAYGRSQNYGYFDFNNDCIWDTYVHGVDLAPIGSLDEVWVDTLPFGSWDTKFAGDLRYDGHNRSNISGMSTYDPAGNRWASMGYWNSTMGGTRGSVGTYAGAFVNLMGVMAKHSGLSAWPGTMI